MGCLSKDSKFYFFYFSKKKFLDTDLQLLFYTEGFPAVLINYLNRNYRRCPAIRLARQLIDEGEIGRIFHWRGAYLQSWIVDHLFPLTWHLQRETAGAGPHNDLNSHSVDLARYLAGEIKSVVCA